MKGNESKGAKIWRTIAATTIVTDADFFSVYIKLVFVCPIPHDIIYNALLFALKFFVIRLHCSAWTLTKHFGSLLFRWKVNVHCLYTESMTRLHSFHILNAAKTTVILGISMYNTMLVTVYMKQDKLSNRAVKILLWASFGYVRARSLLMSSQYKTSGLPCPRRV